MAKLRYEDIRPGMAQMVGKHEEERRGLLIGIVAWFAIAAFGLGISVYTYQSAAAGGRFALWWGPVVFGLWRGFKALGDLRRLDANFRKLVGARS